MKLRSHLVLLVVTALLPLLIFACAMVIVFGKEQQKSVQNGLLDTARALSLAVDRELLGWSDVLETLATSEYLDSGDLKKFYNQARRVLNSHKDWENIVLIKPPETQVLNLRRPFGEALPDAKNPDQLRRVMESRRPVVSDLFSGQVLGKPLVGMAVPVTRAGKVLYVLMSAASPASFSRLLLQQKPSDNWAAGIVDRNKIVIARSRNSEQFLGKPTSSLFAKKTEEGQEGTWRGVVREGAEVYVAHHRSDFSGWDVGVAVYATAVDTPVRHTVLAVIGGGSALLLLGMVLATVFGRRIANSITALSASAAALGQGETPKSAASPIIEVAEVGRALEQAGAARSRSEASLRENQAQMAGMIESAMDGIISVDSEQRITLFNPAAEKMFQRPAKEVMGKPLDCLIPEGFRAAHREHIRLFGRAGVTKRGIGALGAVSGLRANGEVFPIEASISQTETGGRKIFTVILRDITERKRAEEETRRNLERIRALQEIDMAITSTLDLRAVLDILLVKIDLFFPYPSATTIRLFDKRTGFLEPITCRNMDESEWKRRIPRTSTRSGRAAGSMEPVFVRNIQADPQTLDAEFFRKNGLVSFLGIPLIAKDKVLGVLGIYTKGEHEFSNEETEFLTTLAGQAAIAIENAQLYDAAGSAMKELELNNQYLERSLRQLSGLYTALTPLRSPESTHEMMDGIIERLMAATGADAALIRVHDQADGTLHLSSQRGFPDYYLRAVAIPAPGSSVDLVFRNSDIIIAPDISKDPRLKGKVQLQVGLRSCAMLPLKVHDEVRGIIHLASRKLGYFDEEQREHLMAIARQMGIALENKELFDNLRASRDELEKANKIKDEFLSVMSHELRTPLNVVVGYAGMMKDGLLGELNPKQRQALEKIIYRTNDQLSMVNNILHAAVLESEKINVESHEVALSDFLNQLSSAYEAPINKEVALHWAYPSDLPVIKSDSGKLRHILQNLVDNALKFTAKGSVTVSARIRQQDKKYPTPGDPDASRFIEFTVADTGAGISKEHLAHIFDKFRQVDSSETRLFSGVGMGLYIVKQFAELLGGRVDVESELGKGSVFTLTLPCGQ